jgi:hypothetical protein
MLSISKKHFTFFVPDFSITASLCKKSKESKNITGTFCGIVFNGNPHTYNINGEIYHNDDEFKLTINDRKYTICSKSQSMQKHNGKDFFNLTIEEGNKECRICPTEIFYKTGTNRAFFIHPNDPEDFVEIHIRNDTKPEWEIDPASNDETFVYQISYCLGRNDIVRKKANRYDPGFNQNFALNVSEKQLQELTKAQLGFPELQIVFE